MNAPSRLFRATLPMVVLFLQATVTPSVAGPPYAASDFITNPDPTQYDLKTTSGVGNRTRAGQSEYHAGTDFALVSKTTGKAMGGAVDVKAGVNGKVVGVFQGGDHNDGTQELADYNVVVVKTPDGRHWYYGHLDHIDVKVGDDVNAASVLGGVGGAGQDSATGRRCNQAFGNHLHVEVHDDQGSTCFNNGDTDDTSVIGTRTGVYDILIGSVAPPPTGGAGSGVRTGNVFSYQFENEAGSAPITNIRANYGWWADPTNIVAPTGWTGTFSRAGGSAWIEWYTATNGIPAEGTLDGFSYESTGPAGQVVFDLALTDNHSMWTSEHTAGFVDAMMITGVVPEPSTVLVLGCGLTTLAGMIIRRRR